MKGNYNLVRAKLRRKNGGGFIYILKKKPAVNTKATFAASKGFKIMLLPWGSPSC